MNVNYFRTFLCVIEAGTFSAAARQLGLTQPAVSMQIQSLEDYFGTKLIERHGRTLVLTRAGEEAAVNITLLVESLDATRRQIDEMSTEIAGPVLLGASTVPGEQLCPLLLSLLTKRFPRVRPRLVVDSTTNIIERLEQRELDLALVGAQPKNPTLRAEPIFIDEIVLLMHPSNPLTAHKAVPGEALYREPFVGRVAGSGSRMVYERELTASGIIPSKLLVVVEVGSAVAAVNAVEAGLGVALVSVFAAEKSLRQNAVVARRLAGVTMLRPFYLVTNQRYLSRAVAETAALLRSPEARQAVEGRRALWSLD
ncbi:MAG: HTH-type transcriptional activator CmpR [Firmicutes bacterium]|nr:HTH-type transcriptional activator CmpR [candidate division NPL-UPA2 bacterium]